MVKVIIELTPKEFHIISQIALINNIPIGQATKLLLIESLSIPPSCSTPKRKRKPKRK
jgi:hypothetical protein